MDHEAYISYARAYISLNYIRPHFDTLKLDPDPTVIIPYELLGSGLQGGPVYHTQICFKPAYIISGSFLTWTLIWILFDHEAYISYTRI